MAPRKIFVHKEYVNALVPRSSGLFQSQERFPQLAYEVFSAFLNEPLRVLNVDLHVQFAVQECGHDVQLMYPSPWPPRLRG